MTAFTKVLGELVGNKEFSLLDMHKALSIVATLYVEDAINLASEATLEGVAANEIHRRANALFCAWEAEMRSVRAAISMRI